MSARTLKLERPHMHGDDVTGWQRSINAQLARWHADDLLAVDGDYGVATRAFTAKVLYGLGIDPALMAHGVTPDLRIKVRNRRLSVAERALYVARAGWRKNLSRPRVASPLHKILADSWGWHPGVHDGIDLICEPDAPIYAMTDAKVVRVSPSGWWGLHPSGDVSKGDGVIIIECVADVGPFRKGMHLCYGHAEKATVTEGQTVRAGQQIGHAGLAVAWHVHFMVNDDAPTAGFYRGTGDRDPEPFYRWAVKNA